MSERYVLEDDFRLAVEVGNRLLAAFVKHRTATHKIKPEHCETCRESDEAIAAFKANQPTATQETPR